MEGIALRSNTLLFSTVYSGSDRLPAAYVNTIITRIHRRRTSLFMKTSEPDFKMFMTQDILDELARLWPQLIPPEYSSAGEWDPGRACDIAYYLDVAKSEKTKLVDHALSLLSANKDFVAAVERIEYTSSAWENNNPHDVLAPLHLDPWTILTEEDVSETSRDMLLTTARRSQPDLNRFKFRYSAAAATIKFLHSLPYGIRQHARKVVLLEDEQAVAFPACDMRGAIPFCLENPRLCFERRVNLWRALLPEEHIGLIPRVIEEFRKHREQGTEWPRHGRVDSAMAVRAFRYWIKEALGLSAAGMPPNRFSLVFDGDPLPERSGDLFGSVLRKAAWQIAVTKCHPPSSRGEQYELHSRGLFSFSTFPQIVQDIVEGRSFISFNFPVENIWDWNEIYQANKELTVNGWGEKWRELEAPYFRTEPPLPSWTDLRLEQLLPEDEVEHRFEEWKPKPWGDQSAEIWAEMIAARTQSSA